MKVLLTTPIDPEALSLLAEHTSVDTLETFTRQTLLDRIPHADVLLVRLGRATRENIDREVIDRAVRLKMIARHGAGYETVDVAYATQKGIPVTYTAGSNAISVAEYTIGLLFLLARRYIAISAAVQSDAPDWGKLGGFELYGKTIGIVGMGNIGREVARIARALGMSVLAYHPRPSADRMGDLGVKFVALDELLRQSDVVSIHAALTAQTEKLIGAAELALMKPTAILLNTARGKIIDEAALIEALQARRIAAAGLDVVVDDPVKKGRPLLNLDNTVVLPHRASKTPESQKRTALWTVEDILRFVQGKKPLRLVNPEVTRQPEGVDRRLKDGYAPGVS